MDEPRHSFAYLILVPATGGAAAYMDARHDIDESLWRNLVNAIRRTG